MAFNPSIALSNNILAIQTAFHIRTHGNPPSVEELEILKRYSGFGGIKSILLPVDDLSQWKPKDLRLKDKISQLHDVIAEFSADEKEKKDIISSIKNSVLSSFYTPSEITDGIAEALKENNISLKAVLETSAGTGQFIRSLKSNFTSIDQRSSLAIEKDDLTALILNAIHTDDVTVLHAPFESISNNYINSFDIAISNIPFGDVKVYDKDFNRSLNPVKNRSVNTLHTYFFIKALEQVRPGGLIAFISTDAFLNTRSNQSYREYLMEQSSLISAIRLPHNLFKDYAGTEAGTDLIILQKNDVLTSNRSLNEQEKIFIDTIDMAEGYTTSAYFQNYPDRIIANTSVVSTNQYGKPALIHSFTHPDSKQESIYRLIGKEIKSILSRDLQKGYAFKTELTKSTTLIPNRNKKKPLQASGQLDIFDLFNQPEIIQISNVFKGVLSHYVDKTLVFHDGVPGTITDINFETNSATFNPLNPKLLKVGSNNIKDYIALRDAYYTLYQTELESKTEQPELRETLNTRYDQYVNIFGTLKNAVSKAIIEKDALGHNLNYIEYYDKELKKFIKSDIFSQPVSFDNRQIQIKTPADALIASLNYSGAVDIQYMSDLTGLSAQEIKTDLKNAIIFDPIIEKWFTSDEYLSGNVVEKLATLKEFFLNNQDNHHARECLEELIRVQPKYIHFDLLDFNLGERWISEKTYEEFATELFKTDVKIKYISSADEYEIQGGYSAIVYEKFSVSGEFRTYDGYSLLSHALKNTNPQISKRVGDNLVVDPIATQKAFLAIEQIRAEFPEWLNRQSNEVKTTLSDRYNNKFNCYAKRVYNGSHLTFPDAQFSFVPYNTQKNAVHMICQQNGGIIDHQVGTGKTTIMVVASYELKRMGIANKPMIIGLKANVPDLAKAYREIYPKAKILAPDEKDFQKSKRVDLLNSIKNNNWDCIILSHEQFGMIPQCPTVQSDLLRSELTAVEDDLETFSDLGGALSSKILTGLEKRKANLETAFNKSMDKINTNTDDILNFKTMGIDHLLIDESHHFKNLDFTTRHSRVAGLGSGQVVQKCRNLLVALRTMQKERGTDLCATFLSGTTISNSLVELYSLFKYLRPNELKKQDILGFDAWAAIYAKKTTDFEFSLTGQIVQKERLRHFIKVPELAMFYNAIADVKTANDVGLDRPKAISKLINIEPTEDQKIFIDNLVEFARTGYGPLIDRAELNPTESNAKMLIACNAAKLMAMDLRLIDPIKYSDHDRTKCSVSASIIAKEYFGSMAVKGTQLVFSDVGTPKKNAFNIYDELKRKLVEDYGIPKEQIAFVHDWDNTASKKQELSKKMNNGEIRVTIGSSSKLGTGWNVQKLGVATHHLDIPWKPSELEQREGRFERTGNEVAKSHFDNTVKSFIYAVEKSLDVYKFNLNLNKQLFISQIKNASIDTRSIDEGSLSEDGGMNFNEYVAILSGNTDLLDKAKIDKQVTALEGARKLFYDTLTRNKHRIEKLEPQLEKLKDTVRKLQLDSLHYKEVLKYDPKTEVKLNPIKIFNCSSPEPVEIGYSITKSYKDFKGGDDVVIGELYGFKLKVIENKSEWHSEEISKSLIAERSGIKYSYSEGVPNENPVLAARYFLNAIDKVTSLLANTEEKINHSTEQLIFLKENQNDKWPFIDKLNALKAESADMQMRIAESLAKIDTQEVERVEEISEVDQKTNVSIKI